VSGNAQKEQCAANKANWCATADEILWMGRFAYCDYGFYVLLPEKFVGHGNISPNPIHGFLVGLSDRPTTSPVRIADERFVWVNAEYDSLELKSLEDAADSLINHTKELLARDKILLNGKPTTRFKIEYGGPKGKMIEEEVVALRSGILYEIALRTTPTNFEVDSQRFSKILSNSRWRKIPYCS
jgi:hypothetical protein